MTATIPRCCRAAACLVVLAFLAAPAGATSMLTGNTSSLSVDVHLEAPPLSPLDASDLVSPVAPGSPVSASVPLKTLGDASASGIVPMLLTVTTGPDGFSGLSALSGGPFMSTANTLLLGSSALSESRARVDVSFTLDEAFDFVLDVETINLLASPQVTPPMESTAHLRTSLGSTVVLEGWEGSGVKHYAGYLPAGDYELTVGSLTRASADFQIPVVSTGSYEAQFVLAKSAVIPEPLTGAGVLAAVGALFGYIRKRRPAASA